jgi:type IV pilus assembly protein PilY1
VHGAVLALRVPRAVTVQRRRQSMRAPTSTRTRGLLALLAAAALLAPATGRAANKTFSANSLIIPAQLEYQTDEGMLAAYGLIFQVLWRNTQVPLPSACTRPVTFYWAVAPNKLSQYRCNTNTNTLPSYASYNDNDGCDFVVQSADGVPVAELTASNTEAAPFSVWKLGYAAVSGPYVSKTATGLRKPPDLTVADKNASQKKTVMKYLGGAWIVDATDRQCFLAMLSTTPSMAQYRTALGATDYVSNYVRIHSARQTFTAPIARLLNQPPPTIAVTGLMAPFIENVLITAGLNLIPGWNTGAVLERKTEAELLDPTATDSRGLLNATDRYGLFWGADGMTLTAQQRANLEFFLDNGKGAYIEATSVDTVENGGTPLVTTTGVVESPANIPYMDDCNDRRAGVSFFKSTRSGECFQYGGLAHAWAQTGNMPFDGGQGVYKGFTPNAGMTSGFGAGTMIALKTSSVAMAAARYKDNDVTRGLLIYLAGMRFDNARYWGQRMIMNSVLANVPLVLGVELARSEPVGYRDRSVTPNTDRVYQGTYVQLPTPPESHYVNYTQTFPHRWRFPYTAGHLYEYDLTDIPSGSKAFACTDTSVAGTCPSPNWDAGLRVPLPPARNMFTALDGSGHLGWNVVQLDYRQTRSGCLDRDADGKCDLSEVLAQCNTAEVNAEDLLPYNDADSTQRDVLGMFVQQVRGHCSAHNPRITGAAIMEPTDGQCDDHAKQKNTAKLGGIDHGSPAIVGPSRYVTDAAWIGRPVVAYAGSRDGMLHAFYVSGGAGWKDPSGATLPAGVARGQELWAFVPPGQLCGLATNNAMVDASVNVIDVFGQFPTDANGDGVIDWSSAAERPGYQRTWRTVLLAAAGQGGSELFAMDVTSPLKPVLLWHLSGESEKDGRFDLDRDGDWDTFDPADPKTYGLKWFDWDDGVSSTAHIPTDYRTKDPSVIEELKLGKYDYRNLGLTYGTAIGKISVGNAFQYYAYVATNMVDYADPAATEDAEQFSPLGYRGVEVFAIDLLTGEKVWQWEKKYTRTNPDGTVIADDTIPGRVALADVNSDGSVDRIYVGDLEGRMWELDARDGRNLNYLPDATKPDPKYYSLPLYGTEDMTASGANATTRTLHTVAGTTHLAQQPLTSPIGLGRFTLVRKELEPYLLGRLAIVQGAMGVDWSIAPFEPGSVYVLPVSPEYKTRLEAPIDVNASRDPRVYGVLQKEAAWRIPLLVGERVFGMPRVVNNEVIFNTAFGSFSGDITDTIEEAGNLYMVGTTTDGDAAQEVTANQSKSFGGVLVFGDNLIVTTDNAITKRPLPAELKPDADPSRRPFNRSTPAVYKTWEPTDTLKEKR